MNYLLGHKEVGDLVSAHGPRQGRVPDVRRRDRAARRRASARRRVPARRAPPPARFQDRDHAARRRGRGAERPQHDGHRDDVPGARLARDGRVGSGTTSSCRRRTATPARRRSSSPTGGDWDRHERKVVGEQLKVMKRIEPRELAIEGVITRHGTLVGPLMAELVGFRGAHALRRRLVRRRRLAGAAHREAAARRARTDDRDGRAPATGGLPRVLRAGLPAGRRTRATCGSAS